MEASEYFIKTDTTRTKMRAEGVWAQGGGGEGGRAEGVWANTKLGGGGGGGGALGTHIGVRMRAMNGAV